MARLSLFRTTLLISSDCNRQVLVNFCNYEYIYTSFSHGLWTQEMKKSFSKDLGVSVKDPCSPFFKYNGWSRRSFWSYSLISCDNLLFPTLTGCWIAPHEKIHRSKTLEDSQNVTDYSIVICMLLIPPKSELRSLRENRGFKMSENRLTSKIDSLYIQKWIFFNAFQKVIHLFYFLICFWIYSLSGWPSGRIHVRLRSPVRSRRVQGKPQLLQRRFTWEDPGGGSSRAQSSGREENVFSPSQVQQRQQEPASWVLEAVQSQGECLLSDVFNLNLVEHKHYFFGCSVKIIDFLFLSAQFVKVMNPTFQSSCAVYVGWSWKPANRCAVVETICKPSGGFGWEFFIWNNSTFIQFCCLKLSQSIKLELQSDILNMLLPLKILTQFLSKNSVPWHRSLSKTNNSTAIQSCDLKLSKALNCNFKVISWISCCYQRFQHEFFLKVKFKIFFRHLDCFLLNLRVHSPCGKYFDYLRHFWDVSCSNFVGGPLHRPFGTKRLRPVSGRRRPLDGRPVRRGRGGREQRRDLRRHERASHGRRLLPTTTASCEGLEAPPRLHRRVPRAQRRRRFPLPEGVFSFEARSQHEVHRRLRLVRFFLSMFGEKARVKYVKKN